MKQALVFYLYSANNAGDMAICLGTIAYLRSMGYSVTLVSRFDSTAPEYADSKAFVNSYYPDVKVEPGIFKLNREVGKASLALQYAAGVLKCSLPWDDFRIHRLIEDSDVVYFNGGNLLRCASLTDRARLQALFYPIQMARKIGKPCVCLPQSTASVEAKWSKYLSKQLGYFDKIYIREPSSLKKLESLYPEKKFELSTDMAFFMDDFYVREVSQDKKPIIAIVVRGTGIGDIGDLSGNRRTEMQSAIVALAKAHREYEYRIVVQTIKDRDLSEEYLHTLLDAGVKTELVEEHDPFKLLAIYRDCALTLSMRLHACILSIRAGTPVLGFFDSAWGLKNRGVMEDYGMGLVFESDCLASEFDKVIQRLDELSRRALIQIDSHRNHLSSSF